MRVILDKTEVRILKQLAKEYNVSIEEAVKIAIRRARSTLDSKANKVGAACAN